jgi:hypothetical protein
MLVCAGWSATVDTPDLGTGAPPPDASHFIGTLAVANGGTNSSTALSGSSIMISNGTAIVQGAAGTTTTLLHGNAAGAPTYSAASLTADVSGVLPAANGGSGVANTGTLTNASNTTITGGGTLALGGFTLTVPATDTAAELGQANAFTGANSFSQQITSSLATGTAPFSIASTTNVANLNASSLNGATFAAPGAIGGGTPAAITGTAITGSSITNSGATATRIAYAGTAGIWADDSGYTRTSLAVTQDSGSDAILTVGNAVMGFPPSGTSGAAYWYQRGISNPQTNYALQQNSSTTVLNNGGTTLFRVGNGTKATLVTGSWTFASGVPCISSDTTDATSGTTGSFNTLGGIGITKAAWIGTNLTTGGARTVHVTAVTSAAGTTVVAATDDYVVVTGSTTQTLTLPACATGRWLLFKNRSSGNVTINRAGSDTIDGGTSTTLTSNQSIMLLGNTTDWGIN